MLLLLRVFVDDFIQAIAGPPDRPLRDTEELWLSRATLHGIHSIFPSPDITHHTGGRDSISLKKLKLNDGRFLVEKVILGFVFEGKAGSQRTVGLTKEKAASYLTYPVSVGPPPQIHIQG
jgi:hypothetical protein